MSFAQKDRLDRIQYTLLLTTEKNFIENERKMPIFDIFLGGNNLCCWVVDGLKYKLLPPKKYIENQHFSLVFDEIVFSSG